MKVLFYDCLLVIVWIVTKVLFKLNIKGRENIPRGENFIIVAKHKSLWDIPMMALAMGFRKRIVFVARKGLGLGFLYWLTIPINRDKPEKGQWVKIIKAAKKGVILGIFPEGTTDKSCGRSKTGVIRIAEAANIRIIPLSIKTAGPYYRQLFHRDYLKRKTTISLIWGIPITVNELKNMAVQNGLTQENENKNYDVLAQLLMLIM